MFWMFLFSLEVAYRVTALCSTDIKFLHRLTRCQTGHRAAWAFSAAIECWHLSFLWISLCLLTLNILVFSQKYNIYMCVIRGAAQAFSAAIECWHCSFLWISLCLLTLNILVFSSRCERDGSTPQKKRPQFNGRSKRDWYFCEHLYCFHWLWIFWFSLKNVYICVYVGLLGHLVQKLNIGTVAFCEHPYVYRLWIFWFSLKGAAVLHRKKDDNSMVVLKEIDISVNMSIAFTDSDYSGSLSKMCTVQKKDDYSMAILKEIDISVNIFIAFTDSEYCVFSFEGAYGTAVLYRRKKRLWLTCHSKRD